LQRERKNGTTPRVIPRPKPSIDPACKASSTATSKPSRPARHKSGTGEIDGRPVVWLACDLPGRGSERVAVDSETLRPLLVRYEPGSDSYRIDQIRTESSNEANFAKPKTTEDANQPSKGEVISSKSLPLTPSAMEAALPGAVWAGNPLGGLPLTSARRDELRTSFADHTLPPEPGVGLRLEYGSGASGAFVVLMESNRPQFGYQWGARVTLPLGRLSGKLYYYASGAAIGFTVINGIYTTILAANHDLLIRAARSLRPTDDE
jgi:hypothetical protein